MDSDSSNQLHTPERLKVLVSNVEFDERNNILHQFVFEFSGQNDSCSENFKIAVLRSMTEVPVNEVDADGFTALHIVVLNNDLPMVKRLLSFLVNIDVDARCSPDNGGRTALHLAAELGHVAIVEELLAKGASVDIRDDSGETALFHAARAEHFDVMELLVNAGANVNFEASLGSALACCAHLGILSAVQLLVLNGADVNAGEGTSRPLCAAASSGNLAVVEFLARNGADLDVAPNGKAPIHWAMLHQHLDVVEFLIDAGADLGVKDSEGRSLLHCAMARGLPLEIVKLLISKGANLSAEDDRGRTPLHYAYNGECAAFLLDRDADLPHATDVHGWTPLHTAAYAAKAEVVQVLVDRGADVTAKDKVGKTALDLARYRREYLEYDEDLDLSKEKEIQLCIDILQNVC